MNSERDIGTQIPKKAVLISFMAALILFAVCGVAIRNQTFLKMKAAEFSARHGGYETALKLMEGVSVDEEAEKHNEGLYAVADAMLERGDADAAYEQFSALGEYSDSADRAVECLYQKAKSLADGGHCQEAAEILQDILSLDKANELYKQCRYEYAAGLADGGEWQKAADILWSIGDYQDAKDYAKKLVYQHTGSTDVEKYIGAQGMLTAEEAKLYSALIENRVSLRDGSLAVGFRHTVGLQADGTVVACGSNEYGQCDTGEWRGVTQIAAGARHTVALLEDGTVIACGDDSCGQCEVGEWKNVRSIAASDYNTFALLEDGTVASCGFNEYPQLASWQNVDSIHTGTYAVAAIAKNGSLMTSHLSYQMEDERFADAALATAYTLGLSCTGELVSSVEPEYACDDAIAVYAYGFMTAVIDKDYRAYVYDIRKNEKIELPEDKRVLTAALGGTHSAFLLEDGSVWCCGNNGEEQCETGEWNLLS